MTHPDEDAVTVTFDDAEDVFGAWFGDADDILVRAAFERTLRQASGMEDEGLYFRPGGWSVDLTATAARVVFVAAVLAGSFHAAGLEDVDREVIIAAAGFLASMDLRHVRPGRAERRLAERLQLEGLAGVPVTAERARRALPKATRREVSTDEVAAALDNLVAAGLADHDGPESWTLRAPDKAAWIRISLA